MTLLEREKASIRLGARKCLISQLRRSRNRFNVDELSSIYYVDMETLQAILNAIDAHPDWDDEQVAEDVYFD